MYENILFVASVIITIIVIYIMVKTYYDHPLKDTTLSPITESFTIESNYDNYNALMDKLNLLDNNLKNASVQVSNFMKTHPIYDSKISTANYNNIKDYQNVLTTKTADAQFFIDEAIKEKQIALLREELDRITSDSNLPQLKSNTTKYSIKNPYAGVNLNLEPSSNNVGNSLIYVNGKCMTYNNTGDYNLADCSLNDSKQLFKTNQINFVEDYNSRIADSNFKITGDQFAPIIGFYTVQPSSNDKECLTISNGNLSIEPCNLTLYQRWNTSTNKMTC
jgi:hypothetical protein